MVIPQLLLDEEPTESTAVDVWPNPPAALGVPVIAPGHLAPRPQLGNEHVTEGAPAPPPGKEEGVVIALLSKLAAPFRANALPFSTAPVVTVTDAKAMMVPLKIVLVPRVAELPTCQKTLEAWAPPMRFTALLPAAVVSVVPIWKMKTEFGLPLRWGGTAPEMPTEDATQ